MDLDPNKIQNSEEENEKREEKAFSLDDLRQIKEELNSYERGTISLDVLSGGAFKFINSGTDIDIEIEKAKKYEDLEEEVERLEKIIEEKTRDLKNEEARLKNEIKEQERKYQDINEQYDRLDHSGVSTIKMGEELGEIRKEIKRLSEELVDIQSKISLVINDIS
jgi:uncharacterized coiled-coil DUF342 family protein